MARLLNTDWSEMTKAARSSPNNVINDERWTNKAREANRTLNDDQAWRLGQMLKKAHFSKLGRLSAEARRIAREAAAEFAVDENAA